MIIEDFGPRVAQVWNHLRSTTRNLVERAWQSSAAGTTPPAPRALPYDPRADQELIQLLSALDEHATQAEGTASAEDAAKARRMANACADLLAQQTQSAEVFAQLIGRAHQRKDFARVDSLAGLLPEQLAPSEICELARANNVIVRALAQEALTQLPTPRLVALVRDPVDGVVARQALERQAIEFDSAEAQRALRETDEAGLEDY